MASSQEKPNKQLTESQIAVEFQSFQYETSIGSSALVEKNPQDSVKSGNDSALEMTKNKEARSKQLPKGLTTAKVESKKECQQLNGNTLLDPCSTHTQDIPTVNVDEDKTNDTENNLYLALLAGNGKKVRKLLTSKNIAHMIHKFLTHQNIDINYIFMGEHIQSRHIGATAVHIVSERLEPKGQHSANHDVDGVMTTLFELGADVMQPNITNGDLAIHVACKTGNARAVRILLNRVPECKDAQNDDELTPLMRTISNFQIKLAEEYLDIVDTLVEANCNVNLCSNTGTTALHLAVEKDIRFVEKLLNAGANINAVCADGITPILKAVCQFEVGNGDKYCRRNTNRTRDIVKILAHCGADLGVLSHSGTPLLNIALAKGDYEVVMVLLKAGADPNVICSVQGASPLHLAYEDKNKEMITSLLSFGADISLRTSTNNIRRQCSETILMSSIKRGDLEMMHFLLRSGALNERELLEGNNPLFYALKHDKISVAKQLLYLNFPVDYPDVIIPDTIVRFFKRTDILRLLILAGAKFELTYLLQIAKEANDTGFEAFVLEHFRSALPLFYLCSFRLRKLFGLNFAKNLKTLADERSLPQNVVRDVMLDHFLKPV